ncbi:MAG: helix-hairpin-helix domain-containing protein [Candidatus Electrothrix sp. AR4]|nr:helix-hairpin-helix domain-containing protein [Candidatus Electrothrix sp. AR4]
MTESNSGTRDNDLRLPLLIFLGAIILVTGRCTPEPDVRGTAYYLSRITEQEHLEVLRAARAGSGKGGSPDLTQITSDLPCAETPPEFALFFDLPLPVNRADKQTLTMLPGVGPKLSERIIAFREERGDITGPEDFIRIKGIGPKLTERLTPLLCFSGTEIEY